MSEKRNINGTSKHCPRCHRVFTCFSDSPASCPCASLTLNRQTLTFIKNTYNDCLCIECLAEINRGLSQNNENETHE